MITIKEFNSPFDSKRDKERPYLYITKHGIGPGTIPKDVELIKYEDIDDNYTVIWLDRPLSTKELEYYDIYPETRNDKLLRMLGREDLLSESKTIKEVNKGYTSSVQSALDDLYVEDGKIIEDYLVDNIDLFLFNTRKFYDEIKNKRRKSYSVAYEAMLGLFQTNVNDYVDSGTIRVTSDMVKRWFNKYGVDFKQLLIPVIEKIDEEREELTNENLKEYIYDDDEDIDDGDVVYEAKAYYSKSQSSRYGLAESEKFYDASELRDWIWSKCQEGYYVEVYDYEDNEWRYYQYPENGAYMDLYDIDQLETDERGNFLYIDDIGPQ